MSLPRRLDRQPDPDPTDSRPVFNVQTGHTIQLPDPINHPAHYTAGRHHQPIDVIEDWDLGYHLGNAVKYISRAGRKGDPVEDLSKAVWYIQREIDRRTTIGAEIADA